LLIRIAAVVDTNPDDTNPDNTNPDDTNPDQINANSNHTSARFVKRDP